MKKNDFNLCLEVVNRKAYHKIFLILNFIKKGPVLGGWHRRQLQFNKYQAYIRWFFTHIHTHYRCSLSLSPFGMRADKLQIERFACLNLGEWNSIVYARSYIIYYF